MIGFLITMAFMLLATSLLFKNIKLREKIVNLKLENAMLEKSLAAVRELESEQNEKQT